MPSLGESISEATVGQWLKQAGDQVAADEPLVELETDKVTVEVPAPAAGILSEIAVPSGTTVAIGSLLGSIAEGSAKPSAGTAPIAVTSKPAPVAPPVAPTPKPTTLEREPSPREEVSENDMPPSPAARKLLAESGLQRGSCRWFRQTRSGLETRCRAGRRLDARARTETETSRRRRARPSRLKTNRARNASA